MGFPAGSRFFVVFLKPPEAKERRFPTAEQRQAICHFTVKVTSVPKRLSGSKS